VVLKAKMVALALIDDPPPSSFAVALETELARGC